jgi:hypothetical protein
MTASGEAIGARVEARVEARDGLAPAAGRRVLVHEQGSQLHMTGRDGGGSRRVGAAVWDPRGTCLPIRSRG